VSPEREGYPIEKGLESKKQRRAEGGNIEKNFGRNSTKFEIIPWYSIVCKITVRAPNRIKRGEGKDDPCLRVWT